VLIGHSQGGGFVIRAAQRLPELVKAVVALEPHGFPDQVDLPALEKMALLFVLADFNSETPLYAHLSTQVCNTVRVLSEAGIAVELLNLPAIGVKGNSHQIMMDNNNDEIVGLIIAWFDKLHKRGYLD
jgi:pimeloyl-ACP methyl ester carboxylesterase